MNNKIKNILLFSFATLLLLSGSYGFAAQPGQPQPQENQPQPGQPPVYQPKKDKYADYDKQKGARRSALYQQIDQQDEEKNQLLKKTIDTDQKIGLLETNFNEFKERAEKTKKDAEEAREQLKAELKTTQENFSAEKEKILQDHAAKMQAAEAAKAAALLEEQKRRIQLTQNVQYGFTGTMPQNVTDAEARLYSAQAAKVEWENSWGKVGADAGMAVVDFGVGTAKHVVAPILVKGLTPKCEEKIQEYVGKTEFQIRAEEISKNEKEISDINKRILENKEKAGKEEEAQAREMLKIQHRSALINHFAAACQGGNLHTEDCVKMGKMIDAMLLADLAKCYKESTGKDYVATNPNQKR